MLKRVIFIILTLKVGIGLAINGKSQEALSIDSDTISYDDKLGVTIYRGHVLLKRGMDVLNADSLKLHHSAKNKLVLMEAYGQPAHFEVKTDLDYPLQGFAKKISFAPLQRSITLYDDAKVIQGLQTIEGPKLIYHLDNRTLLSEQTGESRTRVVIQPKASHTLDSKL